MDVPEGTWMHRLSSATPETTYTVTSVLPGDDAGVAIVEFPAEDLLARLDGVRDHEDVLAVELVGTAGETALVEVETARPRLLEPLRRAGVPLQTPFEVRDAAATWELTTSGERLSELGDRLAEHGVAFDLEEVAGAVGDRGRLLTDRQREFVRAAVERGYYEVPRETTLTELAAAMGVGKASASDTLARAERRIVERFAERELPESAAGE